MNIFLNYLTASLLAIIPPLVGIVIGFLLGSFRDNNKIIFNKKMAAYSDLLTFVSKHPYSANVNIVDKNAFKDKLIALLAPVRLLADKALDDCTREYFDTTDEYTTNERSDISEIKKLGPTLDNLMRISMEMEQLMREDLGRKRIYKVEVINSYTEGKMTKRIDNIIAEDEG